MTYLDLPERALSIRQPWVWAILNAGKRVENRPRRINYRGPICLHASSHNTQREIDTFNATTMFFQDGQIWCPSRESLQRGGIIGTAEITDCIETSDSDWFSGPYGMVLKNVKPVPFISVKGALGLFKWRKKLESNHD